MYLSVTLLVICDFPLYLTIVFPVCKVPFKTGTRNNDYTSLKYVNIFELYTFEHRMKILTEHFLITLNCSTSLQLNPFRRLITAAPIK